MDPHLLTMLQAAARDPVVAVQAQGPLSIAADIGIVVGALAVVVLSIAFLGLIRQVGRTLAEMRGAVRQNLGPVSDRARGISDNVEFITRALRTDVERLNASVKALSERLQQASDRMEERIEDFNALMEVVQSEAEDIFIDTAAAARGVREGARSIGRPGAATGADPKTNDGALPSQVERPAPSAAER